MKNILKRKIGIAGCGTMGLPMLKILLKNKISATGYDVKPKANFKSIKNNFVESKLSFFDQNEVIISLVRDINETTEICEGKNGLFYFKKPKLLIISSTLSPLFIRSLKKKISRKYNFD